MKFEDIKEGDFIGFPNFPYRLAEVIEVGRGNLIVKSKNKSEEITSHVSRDYFYENDLTIHKIYDSDIITEQLDVVQKAQNA